MFEHRGSIPVPVGYRDESIVAPILHGIASPYTVSVPAALCETASIDSMRLALLFLTLPTRAFTGQQIISSYHRAVGRGSCCD
jgi:hypothetical protein